MNPVSSSASPPGWSDCTPKPSATTSGWASSSLPAVTDGSGLYSQADIERLRRIKTFTEDLGVNLAGAEVALKLMQRIEELEREVRNLRQQLAAAQSTPRRPQSGR